MAAHDGLADGQAEAAAALVPAACQFCAIEWLEEASQVCRGHAGRTVGDVDEDPLALALEKVAMLKAISQASKEWRSTFDGISEPLNRCVGIYPIVLASAE